MDTFIDSPLNKSHRFERKAEDFERCNRFEEAIECHKKAKEYLCEAKKCTSSLGSKQSIDSQIQFHERQEKILAQRQAVYQYKLDLYKNKQKEQMLAKEEKRQSLNSDNDERTLNEKDLKNVTSETEIEKAIYRAIEEHDSLVQFLIYREDQNTIKDDENKLHTSAYKSGTKIPKDDKTVIEELRTNNEQLRELIHKLVGELEKLRKENAELKSEVIKCKENSYLPELPPLEPPNLLY